MIRDDSRRRKARWPPWATEFRRELMSTIHQLHEQGERIMSQQNKLDQDVEALTAGLGVVEQEIADLKAQPQAEVLDFSKLDAAVARLQADAPAPPPPV